MSAIGHTSSSWGLGARDSAAGPAALQVVTNNEQVDFAGGQGKKRTAPISLLISPNLDALLEHEERTRGQNTPARSDAEPGTPETSRQSLTPIAEIPIGLPPPPRYSRGPKSPRTPLVGNMRAEPLFSEVKLMQPVSQESEEVESVSPLLPVSSSTSNPYINPAPTLDDVLGDGISRKEDGVSGGTGTTDVIESPGELAAVGSSENGGSRRASRDGSAPLPWSPTWKQQSQSKYVSLPHVDSACTTNRNEFGKPPDADTQNTQVFQEAAASPSTSSVLGRPASFVAAQIRGRLVKKRSVKASDMRQTPINVVEGVGSGREAGSNNLPWRRRPLISHGPKSSVSSSDSMSSFSTNGPPSTAEHEPRISISSTIYSASSMHSHSQSLYNPPMSYRNSFMEIYSPTNPDFGLDHDSTAHDPVSPIYFSESPISSLTPPLDSHSPKPPIPTAPKPVFNRLVLRTGQPSAMPTAIPLPIPSDKQHSPLPPTTNFLDIDERAELIRKSRKLARVFGQTPGADAMAQQDSNRSASNSSLKAKARSQATLSLTNDPRPRSAWRATAETLHLATPRRHSMPLSPDDISFLSIASPTFENHQPPQTSSAKDQKNRKDGSSNDLSLNRATTPQLRSDSPASFIDLSDDEGARATAKKATTSRPHSPTHSIISTMTVEEDQADEERRRKRERLAKLHRFLGSQVPANLVLGIDDLETSLPPPLPAAASSKGTISTESDDSPRKTWLKRRRSSSAAMLPSFRPDDQLERVKDELDDKEKAINVRRAHKMEQVFGVAPPQTLFHTRQTATPVLPATKPIVLQPTPVVAPPAETASAPVQRNNNRSAFNKTPKPKKQNRPGTAESSKQLLPKEFGAFGPDAMVAGGAVARHSFIYNHYQHSLNSLNDILDRDDRESLAELHEYLNNTDLPTPTATPKADEEFTNQQYDRRLSIASSIKSERRRSLPARTSMISLAPTEYSISTPLADVTPFQLRRRRAAKLTQFFGVNYRELINDVLESIENGVEHEQLRGTLAADEVEDLLTKLRTLKIKRSGLL